MEVVRDMYELLKVILNAGKDTLYYHVFKSIAAFEIVYSLLELGAFPQNTVQKQKKSA